MRLWLLQLGLFCPLLLLLACPSEANQAGFCLQGAHNLPSTDAQLSKGGRSMPPLHPVLAAYDWDLWKPANQDQVTTAYKPCHAQAPIFRYKLINKVLYVDHDHDTDDRYRTYRMAFLEQLVLTVWLYRDFPDALDLVVDFTDHPQLCDQDIPFLRYSILNTSALLPSPQHYNLTELLAPAWVTQEYAARVSTYTRGFTIPTPEAWRDLSLTPAQLADFTSCMDSTHHAGTKQLKAFWRGQATGCSRGWPVLGSHAGPSTTATQAGWAPHLLRNKRVQLALRLFPYGPQYADVGITSLPQLTAECLGPPAASRLQPELQQGQGEEQANPAAPRMRRRRRRHLRPGRDTPSRALLASSRKAVAAAGSLLQMQQLPLPGATAAAQQSRAQTASGHRQLTGQQRLLAAAAAEPGGAGNAVAAAAAGAGAELAAGDGRGAVQMPPARAYRGVASLLHKEGIGLEGWADAALTLSIDGYGPPFRLPQQLLLASAVLRMQSPYQTWLDWQLVPGQHLREFAYDLTDLEKQLLQLLGLHGDQGTDAGGGEKARAMLQGMASAARALVTSKVHLVAQLDAFAWSVARYKVVCRWEVQAPVEGDRTWRVLRLGADVFAAKGVPEGVQVEVMQHLVRNFQAALNHPALKNGPAAG